MLKECNNSIVYLLLLSVLILILMEHAQRGNRIKHTIHRITVLILILMEHAQRETTFITTMASMMLCLNPYFNGTCSKRRKRALTLQDSSSQS